MLRAHIGAALLVSAAVLAGGCGGDGAPAPRPPGGVAPPLSAQAPDQGLTARVTAAALRRPVARYRAYVRRRLGAMQGDLATLAAAVARGDLAAARTAWLRSDARYESIGAAYRAFGNLDRAINGGPGGLPGGVRSPHFTGLHRVELALWGRCSTRDAGRPVRVLRSDVARLRAGLVRARIDPLGYTLRVHEILEDALHLQLSGRASPWSGAALGALRADVRATRVVLGTLRPVVARRAPIVLAQSERALDRVERALGRAERRGELPRWDALGPRAREEVAGVVTAAAERLATVPELIDPRTPRRRQDAFGRA